MWLRNSTCSTLKSIGQSKKSGQMKPVDRTFIGKHGQMLAALNFGIHQIIGTAPTAPTRAPTRRGNTEREIQH